MPPYIVSPSGHGTSEVILWCMAQLQQVLWILCFKVSLQHVYMLKTNKQKNVMTQGFQQKACGTVK